MAAPKKNPLEGRNPITGELPAPELTDAEIEARIAEKIQLQREMSERRGARVPDTAPRPAPKPVDPEQAAQLSGELANALADLAGLEAAEKEAKKAEAEIIAKADADRKDRRQALINHAEEVRARVAEVEKVARAAKLAELAEELSGAADRNAAAAAVGLEGQKVEYKRLFEPILAEIKTTMADGAEFLREYGDALRLLAAQTFTTSPAEFPIGIRQKLSGECYRPAERLLEDINGVLACGSAGGGNSRWDSVMAAAIQTGKLVSPEGLAGTIKYAGYVCRDHVKSWYEQISRITDRLEKLTAEGKAQASAAPQIRITIDDTARQAAKRNAAHGKFVGGRQHEAERGSVFGDT
jgi:hypothetical protein